MSDLPELPTFEHEQKAAKLAHALYLALNGDVSGEQASILAHGVTLQKLAELEAENAKLRREFTDQTYMYATAVLMLGPTARKVWELWRQKDVRRVHYSWGPDAHKLTGEERAACMLEWEEALENRNQSSHAGGGVDGSLLA